MLSGSSRCRSQCRYGGFSSKNSGHEVPYLQAITIQDEWGLHLTGLWDIAGWRSKMAVMDSDRRKQEHPNYKGIYYTLHTQPLHTHATPHWSATQSVMCIFVDYFRIFFIHNDHCCVHLWAKEHILSYPIIILFRADCIVICQICGTTSCSTSGSCPPSSNHALESILKTGIKCQLYTTNGGEGQHYWTKRQTGSRLTLLEAIIL